MTTLLSIFVFFYLCDGNNVEPHQLQGHIHVDYGIFDIEIMTSEDLIKLIIPRCTIEDIELFKKSEKMLNRQCRGDNGIYWSLEFEDIRQNIFIDSCGATVQPLFGKIPSSMWAKSGYQWIGKENFDEIKTD